MRKMINCYPYRIKWQTNGLSILKRNGRASKVSRACLTKKLCRWLRKHTSLLKVKPNRKKKVKINDGVLVKEHFRKKTIDKAFHRPKPQELLNIGRAEQLLTHAHNDVKNQFHEMLRNQARMKFASDIQLKEVQDSLLDFRPRNVVPYDQYTYHFERHDEDELTAAVEKAFTGKGSKHDDPRLHQLVLDSLHAYPELIHMYTRS